MSLGRKRLNNVPSLSAILPKGAEGAKEFARIIDLLLFYEYRQSGRTINIFNDAAGDFRALDSFEKRKFNVRRTAYKIIGYKDPENIDKLIGYQYKFYSSPLSPSNRASIIENIKQASIDNINPVLKKWILITPDDMIESGSKLTKGDVTWFHNLKDELKLEFEIEHWGHTKLIALFLNTPTLCLYYYPELIEGGINQKKTIQDIKSRYDDNLLMLYQNIDFVGMSIYKNEVSKGVPMKHIYIPLKVVSELSLMDNQIPNYINPTTFLQKGTFTVILGDPGSGKSTLLRFLALNGLSDELQNKYNTKKDNRLSIIVVLRRYADELKSRSNLSLLDFILENIQASFNLKGFDLNFANYFLETGQTVILFDGMDELPNSKFKFNIRDRIKSLATTYPGNAIIVTSRIVGYDNPFRFEDNSFTHYRISKLELPEIESFVEDWYNVRIENSLERKANVKDLIRILRDDKHIAIRSLAENPLLLTIIALVHRIDAVLPDERVVLYQKCTETLLNTWDNWKLSETVRYRALTERRNRRRLEFIAYSMQKQSVSTRGDQRSIIKYEDLLSLLTAYIAGNEKPTEADVEAIDLADEFIEFVKVRAGLLIEVGTQRYSFVHLTFQEYLTSTYLIAYSEKDGLNKIEPELLRFAKESKWYEVIRLLVSGLKNEQSQEYLLDQFLSEKTNDLISSPLLLAGLLLDSLVIENSRKIKILYQIVLAGSKSQSIKELRDFSIFVKSWIQKDVLNINDIDVVYKYLWKDYKDIDRRLEFLLFAIACGINTICITELRDRLVKSNTESVDLFRLLFVADNTASNFLPSTFERVKSLALIQKSISLSPNSNELITVIQAILLSFDANIGTELTFYHLMTLLGASDDSPYFSQFLFDMINFTEGAKDPYIEDLASIIRQDIDSDSFLIRKDQEKFLYQALDQIFQMDELNLILNQRKIDLIKENLTIDLEYLELTDLVDTSIKNNAKVKNGVAKSWSSVQTSPLLHFGILEILSKIFVIENSELWIEAIRIGFLPKVPDNLFLTKKNIANDVYFQASLRLLDQWLKVNNLNNHNVAELISKNLKSESQKPIIVSDLIQKAVSGDAAASDQLVKLYDSRQYNLFFKNCYWGNLTNK